MIKYIVSRLTMKIERNLFIDKVNNKCVSIYTDFYNNKFMAQGKYGFRTKYVK